MKHTNIDNRTEINRLKAENARLKAEVVKHIEEASNARIKLAEVVKEAMELTMLHKAEVERLTKAGDAMAEELIRLEAAFNNIESAEAQMWYIAKEGGCP